MRDFLLHTLQAKQLWMEKSNFNRIVMDDDVTNSISYRFIKEESICSFFFK